MALNDALIVALLLLSVSAFQHAVTSGVARGYQASEAGLGNTEVKPKQPEPRHFKTDREQDEQGMWPLDQIFGRDEVPDYSDRQRMNPDDALSLYQTMHVVNALFRVWNITYWAGGGTLLGAMRNKGIIPHDNDIDVHVPNDYKAKLLSAAFAKDLERNGLKMISKDPGQWGITNATLRKAPLKHGLKTKRGVIKSKEPPYAFWIDVYLMRRSADGANWNFENKDKFYRSRAFAGNVTEFPFMKLPFGETFVLVPQKDIAERYLAKIYGSDWKTHVNCQGTHHSCRLAKDEEWALKHCAEPTGPLREARLTKEHKTVAAYSA